MISVKQIKTSISFGIITLGLVLITAIAGLSSNPRYNDENKFAFALIVTIIASAFPDIIAYFEKQYHKQSIKFSLAFHETQWVILGVAITAIITILPAFLLTNMRSILVVEYILLIILLLLNNIYALDKSLENSFKTVGFYIIIAYLFYNFSQWINKIILKKLK